MAILNSIYRSTKRALLRYSEEDVPLGDRMYRINRLFEMPFNLRANYEAWSDNAYHTALSLREGLFLDVGANTGQTLRRILAMDPTRHYLGFEPQSDCVFFLKNFIQTNNLENHTILPIGLSNRTGPIKLYMRHDSADATASTVDGFRPEDFYSRSDYIYVTTGDQILQDLGVLGCAIIKIDVEGGEPEVIEGFARTLSRHRPFVFFEVLNYFLAVTKQALTAEMIGFRETRNKKLMQLFSDHGYCVFNTLPGNLLLKTTEFAPKKTDDLSLCDYVALPQESAHEFVTRHNTTASQLPTTHTTSNPRSSPGG